MSTSNGCNADGLIDGDLDFSNTRTTHEVITEDMGETEYAAINFTAMITGKRPTELAFTKVLLQDECAKTLIK